MSQRSRQILEYLVILVLVAAGTVFYIVSMNARDEYRRVKAEEVRIQAQIDSIEVQMDSLVALSRRLDSLYVVDTTHLDTVLRRVR